MVNIYKLYEKEITMKRYMMLLLICTLVLCVSTGVMAEGEDLFNTSIAKITDAFKGSRAIAFTIGGFALIGLACAAIFGKIQWKWVGALALGLCILAAAGLVVDYIAKSDPGDGNGYTPGIANEGWGMGSNGGAN